MSEIKEVTQEDFKMEARLAEMRQKQPRDLYAEARVFGEATAGWCGFDAVYWAAWYAGRQASGALLDEAKRIGVTAEQWEDLRGVASEVAYD